MKRTNAFIIFGGQLLAGAISAWGPAAAGATEPPPQPAEADRRSVESLLPAPQPVFVEPAPPQAPVINAAPDTGSAQCAPPPVVVGSPLLRLWHFHTKPWQESHWRYADQLCERPFGSYLRSAMSAQVQNGLSAQMVLYHFDFVTPDGRLGAELNLRGRARLEKLVGLAAITPCPIVIELDEKNAALNAARRVQVLCQLRQFVPDFPEEHVVVGRPAARGLAADEAIVVYENLLQQTQTGPTSSMGRRQPGTLSGTMSGVGNSGASNPGY